MVGMVGLEKWDQTMIVVVFKFGVAAHTSKVPVVTRAASPETVFWRLTIATLNPNRQQKSL
jgi:hypothetical protein